MDQEKIKEGVKLLLEGIGEDINREGLKDTPGRIARMYAEVFGGMYEDASEHLHKVFTVDNNEMVLEKDIVFYSMCEHHLLPFVGKASVAYIPRNGKILGLSKIARIVDLYAKRPQLQERLTAQIADFIFESVDAMAVAVVIDAEHLCMTMRGVEKPGSTTKTSALRGSFRSDARSRSEVMALLQ